MISNILLFIFPFYNELIPERIKVWDYRGPTEEICIPDLLPREVSFFIAALPDSYESQILSRIGYTILSPMEWRQAIYDKGYVITHSEVRHELAFFENYDEIRRWLSSLPPDKIEAFLSILQEWGWVDMGDGKIRFPYKRLVLLVESR
ncbi:MAG TPA: hypothetical protein VJK48_00825 [Chlamydiales bacterium]|nr:MAG: hypothetical protein A3F67_11655 [Verrucomicrobia bacterium RIFCSPHIGHO2_12_FULL_41_10]HLB52237.1 hypothetical protein [Chlamydiales bacterium]